MFEVADNGRGIPRDLLPRLFSGVHSSNEQPGEADGKRNMGIGLPVCMTIVQAHGGTMQAENRRQGGALFRFSIPLEESGKDDEGKNPDY